MPPPVDVRARFLKLFGYSFIALALGVVVWGVIALGGRLFREAVHLRCQNNLRRLMEGFHIYQNKFPNQLPPCLATLFPLLEGRSDSFQCPADHDQGRRGCRPLWLRRSDGSAFQYVDLDGPALDPDADRDTLPCSYLYTANAYPCGLTDFKTTWRQEFDALRQKHGDLGKGIPIIRCYYHLPEKYVGGPPSPTNPADPDPEASPTYNVTADLEHIVEYRLDWQSDPQFTGTP